MCFKALIYHVPIYQTFNHDLARLQPVMNAVGDSAMKVSINQHGVEQGVNRRHIVFIEPNHRIKQPEYSCSQKITDEDTSLMYFLAHAALTAQTALLPGSSFSPGSS